MIEIGILIVGFLATLVAIRGETWKSSNKRYRKVTVTGLIVGFLAFLALIFGGVKNYDDNKESLEKKALLENVSSNTDSMSDTINVLKEMLDSSDQKIILLKLKIDAYEKTLNKIGQESERQPQWTFLNAYSLRQNETIRMPNEVYSGSLLKFVGICGECILKYGDKNILIPPFHYSSPLEIPIIGTSGQSYSWSVQSISRENCGFKIYMLSTPRSRSTRWSYEEESH